MDAPVDPTIRSTSKRGFWIIPRSVPDTAPTSTPEEFRKSQLARFGIMESPNPLRDFDPTLTLHEAPQRDIRSLDTKTEGIGELDFAASRTAGGVNFMKPFPLQSTVVY